MFDFIPISGVPSSSPQQKEKDTSGLVLSIALNGQCLLPSLMDHSLILQMFFPIFSDSISRGVPIAMLIYWRVNLLCAWDTQFVAPTGERLPMSKGGWEDPCINHNHWIVKS